MFLKTFEKMQATLLYWFASQQQTSTLKPQKGRFFYQKFSAELNEISFFSQKHQERIKKQLK